MKLFYSNTSPYSRKVRLAVIEKGLGSQIEMHLCNPFAEASELKRANPLGKIPTLLLDDGSALFDSPVICEYLDTRSTHSIPLIPTAEPTRWEVLRWQALADGITDAAYNIVMEQRRTDSEPSHHWLGRWETAINNAADEANANISNLAEPINLAHLSLISALGYLDFRLPELAWQKNRNALTEWYKQMSTRSSVIETQPE